MARELHAKFEWVFGQETIEALVMDSFNERAKTATVTQWLVLGLSVLPSGVVAAMAEVGIDITEEFPKPWTDEFLGAADVVVTMGCGDACPLVPGKHYEDWVLEDPSGKSLEVIRPIRDEIKRRVEILLGELIPVPQL